MKRKNPDGSTTYGILPPEKPEKTEGEQPQKAAPRKAKK